jgi:hypothetical protein
VSGSSGLTSNSKEDIRRVHATAAPSPQATPIAASLSLWPTNTRVTSWQNPLEYAEDRHVGPNAESQRDYRDSGEQRGTPQTAKNAPETHDSLYARETDGSHFLKQENILAADERR